MYRYIQVIFYYYHAFQHEVKSTLCYYHILHHQVKYASYHHHVLHHYVRNAFYCHNVLWNKVMDAFYKDPLLHHQAEDASYHYYVLLHISPRFMSSCRGIQTLYSDLWPCRKAICLQVANNLIPLVKYMLFDTNLSNWWILGYRVLIIKIYCNIK